MSIDALQNKIRKLKNPSALVLSPGLGQLPSQLREHCGNDAPAMLRTYYMELLEALKDLIPAVRVNASSFFLLGKGDDMTAILEKAKALGYYVILDWTQLQSPGEAEDTADLILRAEHWSCDAVVISGYGGTDVVKPWFKAAGKNKDVYVVVKTANKSGAELQDLQTGGRFVYTAAADLLSRMGESALERCGYSRLAVMAGAYNAASLRVLREKYPRMFLLVDGLDQPGCNAKNASYAFDRLGHGALVCAGSSIVGAWKEGEDDADPVAAAVEAAERMKRNLNRYVTIL